MTKDDFEKLVTVWSLRSAISNGHDLGKKDVGGVFVQNKRITLTSKKYTVTLTYSVSENDDFHIISADVYDSRTHRSSMMYGLEVTNILEKL